MKTRVITGYIGFVVALTALLSNSALAQETGTLRGVVAGKADNQPVANATITIAGTSAGTRADPLGRFVLPHVPVGRVMVIVRAIGFAPESSSVMITARAADSLRFQLTVAQVELSKVVVNGASRVPETVFLAPAAVSQVSPALKRDYGPTGQVPQVLQRLPGIDAAQSGMNDFNVNARGFNTTNTRRVIVMLDGRDLALAFLGSQEWPALSIPLEDLSQIEFVRGPGSALYGPNAFSGVLALTSPTAREVAGTKVSVVGGGLGTFEAGIRHAGVVSDGRFGYRVHAGYGRSDTWARARPNPGDMSREYATAIDTIEHPVVAPTPGFESVPLKDDPITRMYGGARFDYYGTTGVATIEGGTSVNKNETSVTGAGRLQFARAERPWGRLAWENDRFKAFAYYSGRKSNDQLNLTSGANIREESGILHAEAQYNRSLFDTRGRLVVGGSVRSLHVDTHNTLLPPETDNRTDKFYSGFGQFEYKLTPNLRAIAAARIDAGNLFDTEMSPKGALIWTVNDKHAFRITGNRAFKTPVILEYFLSVPAAPPADFSGLEGALRASPLGPALANTPQGTLFTNSASVPILALGNKDLDVERITSWELGWKGQLSPRVFATVDGYFARIKGFVTELLPGVNPLYGRWTAPETIAPENRAIVESTINDALVGAGQGFVAAAMTRLPNGNTAIVVSVGNSGRADEYGTELGITATVARDFEIDANYSYSRFDIDVASFAPSALVKPNTPRHKANLSVAWSGIRKLDVRASLRAVSGYDWAGGVFIGHIPNNETVDLIGGYRFTTRLRGQITATNLLDQQRYSVFGGPIIGRRVLAGMTATF